MANYQARNGNPGIYNSSLPTVPNGEAASLAVDSNGRLIVSPTSGGTIVEGTYNVTPPVLVDGQTSALQLDSSGRALVNPGALSGTADSIAINDGTNTAGVVSGDSGYSGVATASATKTITFTTSTPGAQTLLANTNVEGYNSIEIVYTSVGSGLTLQGQWSTVSGGTYVNGTTFTALGVAPTNLGGVVGTIYNSPIHGNYFQLAVSALSSGTFAGTVILRAMPTTYDAIKAGQSGTWTVQPGNTANTTPWLVNALLNPSGTTLNTYSVHLTSNTTTTPTSSTAYISMISISSEVAGTTSTVTIQDKQGTPLKLVNGFSTTSLTTTPTVVNFQTPAKMVSGIDIITAGAVAATVDVWIDYYS